MLWIKRLIIGLLVSLSVVVGSALLLTWVFQDKLKSMAIETLNTYVKAPIRVGGGIDVSFLRSFPKVDIGFKNISIDDPIRANKLLLNADRLSLLVNVYELFQPTISIQKILVADGKLSLYKNKSGDGNYEILKDQDGKGSTSLKLNEVKLQNMKLSWNDRATQIYFDSELKKATFRGDFKQSVFDLELNTSIFAHRFINQLDTFLIEKNTDINFEMSVDKGQKKISIRPSTLAIGDIDFTIDGVFGYGKKDNYMVLKASCKGAEMAALMDLLPNSYQAKLNGMKGKGGYEINLAYSKSARVKAAIELDVKLKDAHISIPKIPQAIEHVNTHITYSSEKDRLAVQQFSSTYDGKPVSFTLSANDVSSDGAFQLSANGVANLAALEKFLPGNSVSDVKGEINFNEFKLHGMFKKGGTPIANTLNGSGSFTFRKASLKAEGVQYENIDGKLAYKNGHLEAENLRANFLSSDFEFNGTIDNLFPYIVEKVKREGNTLLGVDGKLNIQKFDLTAMLSTFEKQEKKKEVNNKINIRDIFSMSGALELRVGEFLYNNLLFKEIQADLVLANGLINIKRFDCRAMGGSLHHVGFIKFTEQNELQVSGDLAIQKLEIVQLFEQADNFGQKTLTSKNIKGKIDATVSFNSYFNDYKDIDLKRLAATVQCNILNGELIQFEPIKVASKFIRVEELDHIYFSDLSNELVIKNGLISIPQMEVQSNAINLNMQGTHSFENIIDYHLKINLRKLLANKFKKNNANEYIEQDPYDGTNIFLTIKGDISNPTVNYDKALAKVKMQEDFKKEKENLKSLFKKDATAPKREDIKEDKYFNTQEKPTYIDFDE